jgi:hypothetical protein
MTLDPARNMGNFDSQTDQQFREILKKLNLSVTEVNTLISGVATLQGKFPVVNADLANMAQNTIKGRVTAGAGSPEDLSAAQLLSMLGITFVNFNGSVNDNLSGTYARAGTTVTVTAANHGLIAGNVVSLDFTSGAAADGVFEVVTVIDENTFTVTHGTSGTTNGNVTLLRCLINAKADNINCVSDLGVGKYAINFSTLMEDADYAAIPGGTTIITATPINTDVRSIINVPYQTTGTVYVTSLNASTTSLGFGDLNRCSIVIVGN